MTKIDYRAIRMCCDACGDTQDFEPYSMDRNISAAGWTSVIIAGYGGARYGKERDLCPKCSEVARDLIRPAGEAVGASEDEVAP